VGRSKVTSKARIAVELLLASAVLVLASVVVLKSKEVSSPFLPHFVFSHDGTKGTFYGQGTWQLEDDESGLPIQSTTMRCYRQLMSCDEATVVISDNLMLPIEINTLKVQQWTADSIIVRGPTVICAEETYTIDLRTEFITGIATRKSACADEKGWPRRLRMIDGYDASWIRRGRVPLRQLVKSK
jgi:hypothetical protein